MFSVKIIGNKEKRKLDFNKTIKNIMSYISGQLNFYNSKIISDNNCIEIISGKELSANDSEIIIEMIIRKKISIRAEDFEDKEKLDRCINEIKKFCDEAKVIEEIQYIPINMR